MSGTPAPPRTLAVVGAGTMGSGIAQKMATEGFAVILSDVDDAKTARGLASIEQTLAEGVGRGIFSDAKALTILSRIRGTSQLDDVRDADLVVEAIYEDLAAKRDLFARLGSICRPDAILATNTSSFLVRQLAEVTAHPERVVGLHYFYHPAKNRLVEVVGSRDSSAGATARAWRLQEAIGKIPIGTADSYGFVVNRFFAPWLIEAIRIVDEGVASIATVEQAAKQAFGIGMGPFELMNVTGLPIALHTANTLQQAFGPMYGPTPSLAAMVREQRLWPLEGEADTTGITAVSDRLAGLAFLVAAALVEEHVGSMEDVDLGARVGLRWRRGPFELMNRHGIERSAALAQQRAERWGMRLPPVLADRRRANEPFTFSFVHMDVSDGVATITIDRPDKLNALNEVVVAQLSAAFEAAAADPAVRGIVIAGRGRAFVAGADIGFFIANIEAGTLDRIVAFTRRGQELLAAIAQSPKPVIARVQGMSLGGGVELALACHAIVAAPEATFAFPETGIGIYPGLGGTQRTTRRVGTGLAKWLVLTGERVDATRARAIGLVDRVAPADQLDAAVRAALDETTPPAAKRATVASEYQSLAEFFDRYDVTSLLSGSANGGGDDERIGRAVRALTAKAPIALRIAGELIDRGANLPIDRALALELDRLLEIFATKDAYEGLTAIGRRQPVFTAQ